LLALKFTPIKKAKAGNAVKERRRCFITLAPAHFSAAFVVPPNFVRVPIALKAFKEISGLVVLRLSGVALT